MKLKHKIKINKSKIKSKVGMTLLELIIGITIVVIVFASTLGAMVSGYATTVYNAQDNRASVLNSSRNEIVFTAFKRLSNVPMGSKEFSAVFYQYLCTNFRDVFNDSLGSGSPDYSLTTNIAASYGLTVDMSEGSKDMKYLNNMNAFSYNLAQIIYEQVVYETGVSGDPDVKFVGAVWDATEGWVANFDTETSYQIALLPATNSTLTHADSDGNIAEVSVDGIIIKTCYLTTSGQVLNESFVPFSKKYSSMSSDET